MLAVRRGELGEGSPLPSIREIARLSGLSPGTVGLAFRILRERGVIFTSHGKRARISNRPVQHRAFEMRIPAGAVNLAVTGPDPKLLPDVNWLLSAGLFRPTLYDQPHVDGELGAALTDGFTRDGIHGELTITNGALDALERLLLSCVRPGANVVVEDPSWGMALNLLNLHRFNLVGVPVDDYGLIPEALADALSTGQVALVLLTPRGQNPYGSAMSAERTALLSDLLSRHPDVIVVEDDHAALISDAPATTLTAGRDRFAVIRSLNKTLGPDLRLAAMMSDPVTADDVQRRQLLGPGWVSHFTQRLAARLLTDSTTLNGVRRAEEEYSARRKALLAALDQHHIAAHGRSGLNVAIPVPDETTVVSDLLISGWAVRGGADFRLRSPPFIRVCTAQLPQQRAPDLATSIALALRGRRSSSLAP
ncbi:DNA-binding transcriptional MocR family regulator [Marihabitans asiaticum]|uniref:DNA-binding transcriptional MocR family regulator n=1 Tax=Marihabitans asiaticum TaxID=415218 RepID=A0A560WGL3_9MICO|nr:DNA-binding transcriptional MocR family regulator [Marihabitans asiaticum]